MQFFIPNRCPSCHTEGRKIKYENILANLRSIEGLSPDRSYHFCTNPECEVVYYSEKAFWKNEQLLRPTAQKSNNPLATVCYCFDYKIKDINPQTFEEYQIKKKKGCACGVRNPSGKCCAQLFKSFL